MRCEKYLDALRNMRKEAVTKHSTRGERVIGSLFPNRGTGWPSGWTQSKLEQVNHFKHWVFVAIDTILCKTSSIYPNIAYIVDKPKPGHTVKACQRGLMNLAGRGFGGSPEIDGQGLGGNRPQALFSDGGHSFLTVGEYRSKALSVVKPHEELEPVEADHHLRRLIENPNPLDTFFS